MRYKNIWDCAIIELPRIKFREGDISVFENNNNYPFQVKGIFYIYDIPSGADRGAHAHINAHQFIVSVCGSFEIEVDDGKSKRTFVLNRPNYGLHIAPGIWSREKNFSSGAVCLVLTSELYNEKDYIRDYKKFLQIKANNK